MKRSVLLKLACECTVTFRRGYEPLRGEEVYCVRHDRYEEVVDAPASISIKCTHGRCVSRNFGRDMQHALSVASAHVSRRNTHTVIILDGEVEVDRVTMVGTVEQLPFAKIIEDRIESNREHQSGLRQLRPPA